MAITWTFTGFSFSPHCPWCGAYLLKILADKGLAHFALPITCMIDKSQIITAKLRYQMSDSLACRSDGQPNHAYLTYI